MNRRGNVVMRDVGMEGYGSEGWGDEGWRTLYACIKFYCKLRN